MDIKIMGPGCPNCDKVEKLVNEVLEEEGIEASVEKVTDMAKITEAGVIMTPGLVVNDEVKISGKVPSKDKVAEVISAEK